MALAIINPTLDEALERLSQLHGQLEGSGGRDKVTARDLRAKIEAQTGTVVAAYREQKFGA